MKTFKIRAVIPTCKTSIHLPTCAEVRGAPRRAIRILTVEAETAEDAARITDEKGELTKRRMPFPTIHDCCR